MNGRIWRNAYFFIEGNQFLLSDDFLKGSVCMHANLFSDIKLKYDIFNDELLTPISDGGTLQLNKEMVDSFYFAFQNKTYRFIRLRNDSIHMSDLFFHVLYRGNSSLYARYIKKIDKLSVGGSNERFYQINTLYFVKDDHLYQINGKRDLMRIMSVKKAMIRAFIRNNKIDISDKNPESFIPVIRYFDSLSQKPDL